MHVDADSGQARMSTSTRAQPSKQLQRIDTRRVWGRGLGLRVFGFLGGTRASIDDVRATTGTGERCFSTSAITSSTGAEITISPTCKYARSGAVVSALLSQIERRGGVSQAHRPLLN
jgi:hypothetical protein